MKLKWRWINCELCGFHQQLAVPDLCQRRNQDAVRSEVETDRAVYPGERRGTAHEKRSRFPRAIADASWAKRRKVCYNGSMDGAVNPAASIEKRVRMAALLMDTQRELNNRDISEYRDKRRQEETE